MTLLQFFVLLIVAGICGSLAQSLVGYSHSGCLVSVVLGLIGALLGTWIAHALGLPEIVSVRLGEENFPVIWSVIGAAIFVAILSLVSGRRRMVD